MVQSIWSEISNSVGPYKKIKYRTTIRDPTCQISWVRSVRSGFGSDLQQILHGHMFSVWATHYIIRSRTVFLGRRFSEAPGSL